jgi:hypothetical protein
MSRLLVRGGPQRTALFPALALVVCILPQTVRAQESTDPLWLSGLTPGAHGAERPRLWCGRPVLPGRATIARPPFALSKSSVGRATLLEAPGQRKRGLTTLLKMEPKV